ncbi:hypothetical protein [Candidatus Reidiella endopervernicosa]|uniref:hypothetical protein n=1 Tax=Candidatus Reidiella endopervernicosa TaxID=2738883 RepID=UPI003B967CB7
MVQALERYEKIDLVYAHNDPMAYGAYLAAADLEREKESAFLGIDGIPAEGIKWVHEGILTATFLIKPRIGESLFLRKFVLGIQAQANSKT